MGTVIDDVVPISPLRRCFSSNGRPDKDIHLYINSPCGSVTAGLGVYDTSAVHQNPTWPRPAGAGGQHGRRSPGRGRERQALPSSQWAGDDLITLGGSQGQASDIEIILRRSCHTGSLNRILVTHTGQDLKRIERDSYRNFFMSASRPGIRYRGQVMLAGKDLDR